MTDYTDFSVIGNNEYTHIVSQDGNETKIYVEEAGDLIDILDSAQDMDYDVLEPIGDKTIPHILYRGDPQIGSNYLQSIVKKLYNVHAPVCIIHSSKDDGNILCIPQRSVNREMLAEIEKTFSILCNYEGDFSLEKIKFIPLTWETSFMNEGQELDAEMAYHEPISQLLSMVCTDHPMVRRIKMTAKHLRQSALVDSILMYTREEAVGDARKAIELVPMISKDRSRNNSSFISMGKCLHRIFDGKPDGLDLWKSSCIEELVSECDKHWNLLDTTSTYYRVSTLQYWAKEDSPEEYTSWNSKSINVALECAVLPHGGDLDIARVAFRKDPTLFITMGDSTKEAVFFRFNGTYYEPVGEFVIQDFIAKDVLPEFENYAKELSNLSYANATGNVDTSFTEGLAKKIERCGKIIILLKGEPGQIRIVKVLMRLYNRKGFDNIRDSNPYLTAFEDCIFDAEKCIIRDGIPEDNITCSTGYKFKDYYNEIENYIDEETGEIDPWKHPHVKLVIENISKIVFDPEKREVLRREFASLLHASNPLKRGVMVHGPTNNGKSAIYSWAGLALGGTYCPDIPNNLLYSKDEHPGKASPHIELIRFARLGVQGEVDDSMTLNESLYKRITGGCDRLTYRQMYAKKIQSFTPTCVPHSVFNSPPKINGNSAALRTRTIVIYLDSKFISRTDPEYEDLKSNYIEAKSKSLLDNIGDMDDDERMLAEKDIRLSLRDEVKNWTADDENKEMEKHQLFWLDPYFNNTIAKTYRAFMWVMIQDYKKNSSGGFAGVQVTNLPISIKRDTNRYFIRSNIFLQFISAATQKKPGARGISEFHLYNAYKKWYSDTISRQGSASLPKFKEELASMNVRSNSGFYPGLILTYGVMM